MTRTRNIFLATLVVLLSPMAANAIPITTSVGDFEVTTVVGTRAELDELAMAQVWWGDFDLASEFAGLVQDAFGWPNLANFGVFFAYALNNENTIQIRAWCRLSIAGCTPPKVAGIGIGDFDTRQFTWAVAESTASAPVPEPTTLALLGLGLAGMGFSRRKKKV